MCDVRLRDRKLSTHLRKRLGFANTVVVWHQAKLRWFGHVETIDIENPVSNLGSLKLTAKKEDADDVRHKSSSNTI